MKRQPGPGPAVLPQAGPEVLVLDLGGVLRRWDPAIMREAEDLAGLEHGALVAAVFDDRDLLRDAVTGVISDDEWRTEIAHRLARSSGSAAAAAVASWSEPAGGRPITSASLP